MHTWEQAPLDLLERVISIAAYMSKVGLLRPPCLTLVGTHSFSPNLVLGLLRSSLSADIDVVLLHTPSVWHHVSISFSLALFVNWIASQNQLEEEPESAKCS